MEIRVDGITRLEIDDEDALNLRKNPVYEGGVVRMMNDYLRKGDIFVDVGAHNGVHTIRAARIVGKSGSVFAFEPCPENFARLLKNVSENGIQNVFAFALAASDKERAAFLEFGESFADQWISDAESNGGRKIGATTVDAIVSEFRAPKRIRLMKIDTQGHEYHALRGARATVARTDVLIVEYYPLGLARYHVSPDELVGEIERNGFKRIRKIARTSGRLSPFSVSAFAEFFEENGDAHLNLLAER